MSGVNQAPDYVKTMGLGFSTCVHCMVSEQYTEMKGADTKDRTKVSSQR